MKPLAAALGLVLIAAPATAQPFVFRLSPQPTPEAPRPPPSPVPVAPPQADASPGTTDNSVASSEVQTEHRAEPSGQDQQR